MAWAYLISAGLLEVVWAFALKQSDGFSKLVPSIVTVVAGLGSFCLLALAMRGLPLGTAYAMWTGIGALGAFLVGIIVLGEGMGAASGQRGADPAGAGRPQAVVAGLRRRSMTSPLVQAYWESFRRSAPGRESARLFEAFSIGNRPEHADHGATVILSGQKTTTSSLNAAYDAPGTVAPFVGALSVVLDGQGRPVCVVETVETEVRRLGDVDAAFARDYGEWGGTLEGWRAGMIAHHAGRADLDTPLLCERFRVVWTA